ncbi:MAG TPA: hypothetical protein VK436_05880 [Methanocella sp.]|nr:hypothetical protein [Methanocella sp.]
MPSPDVEAWLFDLIGDVIHGHKPTLDYDNTLHAEAAHTFGATDNGKEARVKKGDVITVRLEENDPALTWHFKGLERFILIDDTSMGACPTIHRFRVKAAGSGLLSFDKIDSRGKVVDTYLLHVKVGKNTGRAEGSHVPDMTKVRFFSIDSASLRLCMARLL